jgi:hypothetical protein
MKATVIPTDSKLFWLRCERPAAGNTPAEVWFSASGTTRAAAETERDFCRKQWTELKFEVADHIPQT